MAQFKQSMLLQVGTLIHPLFINRMKSLDVTVSAKNMIQKSTQIKIRMF